MKISKIVLIGVCTMALVFLPRRARPLKNRRTKFCKNTAPDNNASHTKSLNNTTHAIDKLKNSTNASGASVDIHNKTS